VRCDLALAITGAGNEFEYVLGARTIWAADVS
jgi:hypothetical protein